MKAAPNLPEPRYEHDCEVCVFLGCLLDMDIYVCPQGTMPTLVARYSDFGPDYQSGEDIYFTRLMLPLLTLTGPRRDLATLLEALNEGHGR